MHTRAAEVILVHSEWCLLVYVL